MTPLERAEKRFENIIKAANSGRYADARYQALEGLNEVRRAIIQEKSQQPQARPLVEVQRL